MLGHDWNTGHQTKKCCPLLCLATTHHSNQDPFCNMEWGLVPQKTSKSWATQQDQTAALLMGLVCSELA